MAGGLFLIWKAVKEIYATVELSHEEAGKSGGSTFSAVVTQIVILDVVFSLDSVITAVGLTSDRMVIISAVVVSFVVVLFFAKPIGDYILAHASLKILALAFLIVIGVTIFMEGHHWEVDKKLIYVLHGLRPRRASPPTTLPSQQENGCRRQVAEAAAKSRTPLKHESPTTQSLQNEKFLNSPQARSIRVQCELIEPEHRLAENEVNHTIVFFARPVPRTPPRPKRN